MDLIKISEASRIGMHAVVLLAVHSGEDMLNTKDMASGLSVSEAHLSKVLQRLARVGVVKSVRGPRGGFKLALKPDRVTMLNVFEAVEGPLLLNDCVFDEAVCDGENCIFGDLIKKVNTEIKDYLSGTTLADLKDKYAGEAGFLKE